MPRFVLALSAALAFAATVSATPLTVRQADDAAALAGTPPAIKVDAPNFATTVAPIDDLEAEASLEPDAVAEPSLEPDAAAETSDEPAAGAIAEVASPDEPSAPVPTTAPVGDGVCGTCDDVSVCTDTPWNGAGTRECLPKPPACYPAGQRNIGATNQTYVPYAPCCDGKESVARPGDYGRFCPKDGMTPMAGSAATAPLPGAEATITEAPVTGAPVTGAAVAEAAVTGGPTTEATVTGGPTTEATVTGAPTTEATVTGAAVSEAATTEATVTGAAATEAATTGAAATEGGDADGEAVGEGEEGEFEDEPAEGEEEAAEGEEEAA